MENESRTQYYKETIDKMEKHLQVFTHDSCQVIYTYLKIFGKMTHKNLMDKLDFSRGTIFKSLLMLQEAGFVEKGMDPTIKDKRKSAFYFAQSEDVELMMNNKFREYIHKAGKLDIYKEWLKNSLTISTTMIKTAYQVSVEPLLKRIQTETLKEAETEKKEYIITYNDLNSINDRNKLIEKIKECIKEFEEQIKGEKRDYKDPLKNPVAFAIYYIPLEPLINW